MVSNAEQTRNWQNFPEAVRLTYSNCPIPNALLTALESGLLAEAGIALDNLSGPEVTVHFTYDQPAYTRYGGEIPLLLGEGLRAPGRTRLLGITPYLGRQGLFVSAASPIHRPADLAGKRVGVSDSAIRVLTGELGDYLKLDPWRQTLVALGTWDARALLHTLEAGGLTLGDVTLVRIASSGTYLPTQQQAQDKTLKGADLFPDVPGEQAAILERGEVDALFAWLPWAAELEARTGARPVIDLGEDARNAYAVVWTVSSSLVDSRPEVVQRLVDAGVRASVWAKAHGDAVTELHAKNLGVSKEAIAQGFGRDFHEELLPRLDGKAFEILERTQQFLLDKHLLHTPVALEQWAAPEFLNKALEGVATRNKPRADGEHSRPRATRRRGWPANGLVRQVVGACRTALFCQ